MGNWLESSLVAQRYAVNQGGSSFARPIFLVPTSPAKSEEGALTGAPSSRQREC